MGVMNTEHARELRKRLTEAEQRLCLRLKRRQVAGMKFQRQQPSGVFVADFVCFERKLIIEVDGGQHAEQVSYDKERSRWFEAQGYRVLRFWNNEVLSNTDAVAEVIFNCVEDDPPP